jgi:hypothetical protein
VKKLHVLGVAVLSCVLAFVLLGLLNDQMTEVSAQAKEVCDNKVDDDGDKAIDCADSDCVGSPSCTKTGTGCSPGYYKNHPELWTGICCGNEGQRTCADIMTALTCKGGDAACGRSAAAAYLDACTNCSE